MTSSEESTDSDRTLSLVEGCCSPAVALDPIVALHREIMGMAVTRMEATLANETLPLKMVLAPWGLTMPTLWMRMSDISV